MGRLLGAAGRPPREPWKGASRAPLAVRKAWSGNVPRAPWGFTAPAGGRQQTASPRETLTRCVHVTGRHPFGKNQKRKQTKNTNKQKNGLYSGVTSPSKVATKTFSSKMAEELAAAEKSRSEFIPPLPFPFPLSPAEILPGSHHPKPNAGQGAGSSTEGTADAPTMKTRLGFPFCGMGEKLQNCKSAQHALEPSGHRGL